MEGIRRHHTVVIPARVSIPDIYPVHSTFREKALPVIFVFVFRNRINLKTFVMIFLIQGLQFGNGFPAGPAPGGPEVQEDVAVGRVVHHGAGYRRCPETPYQ